MSEAVAIFGFVLSMLSHEVAYYLAFAAPAVLLYLVFRPQLARYEAEFEAQQASQSEDPSVSW
jgi:hypothetical protein